MDKNYLDNTELRDMFDHYDSDGNGAIDKAEFALLCDALDAGYSAEEIAAMFHTIDTNGNGIIEFSEFVEWWRQL